MLSSNWFWILFQRYTEFGKSHDDCGFNFWWNSVVSIVIVPYQFFWKIASARLFGPRKLCFAAPHDNSSSVLIVILSACSPNHIQNPCSKVMLQIWSSVNAWKWGFFFKKSLTWLTSVDFLAAVEGRTIPVPLVWDRSGSIEVAMITSAKTVACWSVGAWVSQATTGKGWGECNYKTSLWTGNPDDVHK